MIAEFPLGQLLPDQPDKDNPGLVTCDGAVPVPGGYGPFPGGLTEAIAVTGAVRGARAFERRDGTRVLCIGTVSDLFTIVGTTLTASGLGLTVGAGFFWQFEQYGQMIIAVCPGQTPKYITAIETVPTFVALTGSPPQARCLDRVGDFVVMGNLVDIDASTQPYRIRWSAFNNPAGTWTDDIATQCGAVDMDQVYGPVIGIVGGRYDMVFQKYGVSRISYRGGNTVFGKELIEEKRGCIATASLVSIGNMVYGLAHDGFFQADGAQVSLLSADRVYKWFIANADPSYLSYVQGSVDWIRKVIVWNFYPIGQTSFTRQIMYAWEQDRWSTNSLTADWLFGSAQTGLDLDTTDSGDANDATMDAGSPSLDSLQYQASGLQLGGFVGTTLYKYSGSNVAAEFETGEFQPKPGSRAFVSSVTPLIETADMNTTVAIGKRTVAKGGAVMYSADQAQGAAGFCPARVDGRYLRARIRRPVATTWDKASGFQVDFVPSGAV